MITALLPTLARLLHLLTGLLIRLLITLLLPTLAKLWVGPDGFDPAGCLYRVFHFGSLLWLFRV
jgi:hypothetical protein